MKLIAACDGRDLHAFLSALARTVPLQQAEVIVAHVVDSSFEESRQQIAGHRWIGRRPGPQEQARVQEAAMASARAILDEALAECRDWPATSVRPVALHGNPERELVSLALAENADLVAVGQNRRELGPHAIGRCARFVIDHAPCPVLLVRDDALRGAAEDLLRGRLRRPEGPRHSPPQR